MMCFGHGEIIQGGGVYSLGLCLQINCNFTASDDPVGSPIVYRHQFFSHGATLELVLSVCLYVHNASLKTSSIKCHKISSSIIKNHRHKASLSTVKHHQALSSIIKHRQALSSIVKHHQASSSIVKHL